MPRFQFHFCKQLLWLVLSLPLLACAFEVGLRYYDRQTGEISRSSSRQELYLTESPQTYFQLHRLQKFTVTHPDTGEPQSLTTNSFGLRGPEFTLPKPAGTYRIICLGDERVLAAETAFEKTFGYRLQALIQTRTRMNVEVINAGLPGASPLISYIQFRQNLTGLQPDLVILNFDMSDIADDYRCRPFLKLSDSNQPLTCSHPALIHRMNKPARTENSPFLIIDWGKSQLERLTKPSRQQTTTDINSECGRYAWIRDNPPDWSVYIQQALSPIEQIHALTEGLYAQLIVATYPAPWQISGEASNNKSLCTQLGIVPGKKYSNRKPFVTVEEFTIKHQLQYCDASPYFLQNQQPEQFYLKNAVRFSEQGHELYARVLASFIVTRISGDWSSSSQRPPQATAANRKHLRRQ